MPSKRRHIRRSLRAPRAIPAGLWAWLTDAPFDPACHTGRLVTFTRDHADLWFAHRDEVLAFWIHARPGTRPSLWWRFEAAPPLRDGESELSYLRRHRLLTADEARRCR